MLIQLPSASGCKEFLPDIYIIQLRQAGCVIPLDQHRSHVSTQTLQLLNQLNPDHSLRAGTTKDKGGRCLITVRAKSVVPAATSNSVPPPAQT